MKYTYLILTLLLFGLSSCEENEKERITRLVNEWQGKQIVFPENPVFTRYLTDTTDFQIPSSEYKVLVYVDSLGCTSCKLQLDKWKEFIEYVNSITESTVPFVFFFHPKNYKEVQYLLKRDRFNLPVCIDTDDQLNKLNRFPDDITFQTFLLDKDNKVIALGSPVQNTAVKDLYVKRITGKDNVTQQSRLQTTAEVQPKEVNFGTFTKSESKEAVIEIKNTGNNPLVIADVNTTCGCTTATYDKQPAKTEETLKIKVTMTPKDTGFFDEIVTIKYNSTNNQPVKVNIKGNVRE